MTRLKLRFEALATKAYQVEKAMRMLVGALGDDCPNPGVLELGKLQWHNTSNAEVLVLLSVRDTAYVVMWALSPRHATNSEDYEDPVKAAKKIRQVLKKAGIE